MSDQMTPGAARVVDPVLTAFANGFTHPERVGFSLFPRVPVGQRGGQVIEFGKESFKLYNTLRAPGSNTKRIQTGYLGRPYGLKNHSLEASTPDELQEEARAVPGINLQQESVGVVMDAMTLEVENEQASIARDPANYDASHKEAVAAGDQWSADTATPIAQVKDNAATIRASIGMRPNTLVIGSDVFDAVAEHPSIVDRVKYTSARSVTTAILAELFGVDQVLVGNAIYADADGDFVDVWGKDGILAFVPMSATTRRRPSYGYTYVLRDHPVVEQGYRDQNAKSFINPVTYERSPELTGMLAGFLMQDLVA